MKIIISDVDIRFEAEELQGETEYTLEEFERITNSEMVACLQKEREVEICLNAIMK